MAIGWWIFKMPTFVVTDNEFFMKVTKEGLSWFADHNKANTYTSKYQARRHLKELDNVPEGVKIIELSAIEENVNG